MKKMAMRGFALLICICMVSVTAYGVQYLVPGGQVIGLELADQTVTVAAFDDTLGQPAQQAGLCIGDKLLQIDEIGRASCRERV